jgi:transposase
MAYNFRRGNRDQPFLLPPDLRDWLPADHLAWLVLDVVDRLDLQPFLRAYRADGHGHPAYDPTMLLGVLLYAYAIGVRSSHIARDTRWWFVDHPRFHPHYTPSHAS